MSQNQKKLLLEQLRKTPIVQIACEKVKISRATYYRWRKEDKEFKKSSDESIIDGESLITDMTESQLISLIRERNFHAINLWLKHHHPKYAPTLKIDAQINGSIDVLDPEQEALVREALRLATLSQNNPQIYESENNTGKSSGSDDKGQEGPSGNN